MLTTTFFRSIRQQNRTCLPKFLRQRYVHDAKGWRACRWVTFLTGNGLQKRPGNPKWQIHHQIYSCSFSVECIQPYLLPPVVFLGLLVSLWSYKCIVMVLFQDKIIYMPYMPPFARKEKIEDYALNCQPVQWKEARLISSDGTRLSLCIGQIQGSAAVPGDSPTQKVPVTSKEVVICYFQGNGSSTPPRLPMLSNVLKLLQSRQENSGHPISYKIIALSYRGYWNSGGRASQRGIELDAKALLEYVQDHPPGANIDREVVLWGQSIGAGVATTVTASYLSPGQANRLRLSALILETPFVSIRNMLIALYPQKWLPYRYLWPFLWNHWNSDIALRTIARTSEPPQILLLSASKDEIVPSEEVETLEKLCHDLNLTCERTKVLGALHTEATVRSKGQRAVAEFVLKVSNALGRVSFWRQ